MELAALRVFQAVAREGSVSRAAAKLNYVQSNVTARVRQLEDELDTKLFHRKPRGMSLSPAGLVLAGYADKLLGMAEEAERAVREDGGRWGPLAVGSLNSVASFNLPTFLAGFLARHPQVEVSLLTGKLEELVQEVLDYGLEGTFLNGPVTHPDLEAHLAFVQELVLVHAKGKPAPPKPGAPQTILVFPSQACPHRGRLLQYLRDKGQVLGDVTELGSLEAILGCVAAGMGVSLVPRIAVELSPCRDKLAVKKLPPKYAKLDIVFVRRKDALMTKSLAAFLETLREAPQDD